VGIKARPTTANALLLPNPAKTPRKPATAEP
jgi:hypothetical protein